MIDLLIELSQRCHLVPLLGNHDRMMLAALEGELSLYAWATAGGSLVLDSYDPLWRLSQVPIRHHQFLRSCKLFHETDEHLFVHASYAPEQPLGETAATTLLWDRFGRPYRRRTTRAKSRLSGTRVKSVAMSWMWGI